MLGVLGCTWLAGGDSSERLVDYESKVDVAAVVMKRHQLSVFY